MKKVFIFFFIFLFLFFDSVFADDYQQTLTKDISINGAPATIALGIALSTDEIGVMVCNMLSKGGKITGGYINLGILALTGAYYLYENWDSLLAHFKDPSQNKGFYKEVLDYSSVVRNSDGAVVARCVLSGGYASGGVVKSYILVQNTNGKVSCGGFYNEEIVGHKEADIPGYSLTYINSSGVTKTDLVYAVSPPEFKYNNGTDKTTTPNKKISQSIGTPQQAAALLNANKSWLNDIGASIRNKNIDGEFGPDTPWPSNRPLDGNVTQGSDSKGKDPVTGQTSSGTGSDKSNTESKYTMTTSTSGITTITGTTQTKTDYGTMSNPDQPVFGDFDKDMSSFIPEKKDVNQVVSSWVDNAPFMAWARSFKVTASGGQSSFSIPTPFGSTGIINFSQFDSLWSAISTIVIAFAYIYAACIILKGN